MLLLMVDLNFCEEVYRSPNRFVDSSCLVASSSGSESVCSNDAGLSRIAEFSAAAGGASLDCILLKDPRTAERQLLERSFGG